MAKDYNASGRRSVSFYQTFKPARLRAKYFERRARLSIFRRAILMIKLTRFNSDSKTDSKSRGEFILNAELIQTIETTPDTVITLVNEKKLIVEESAEEVVRRVMKYRRALKQL